MDVVHQNDAAAFRIQPPHGALHHRSRGAAAPPIVGIDVRAPGDKLFTLQEPFDFVGAAEAGMRKKGESALASPSAAVTELMPLSTSRSTRRIDRR